MNLPKNVLFSLDRLESHGYSAYLVGGCVRDYIMGIVPHDFDITTNASPDQIQKCFCDVKTIDVGKKHGTITLVIDKECIEVTTYRIDGNYLDNRHPESVEFTDKIELDLSRRDFTMNAICYSPKRGFYDCFNGREDIENRVIRCVGNPDVRFEEDALRLLRALRFACRLGFEIDKETSRAIFDKTHLLSNIASERITSEMIGILQGRYADRIVKEYKTVFEFLYPELEAKTDRCIDRLSFGLYGFFSALEGQDVTPVLKRMKLDNKTVKSVSNVVLNLPRAESVVNRVDVKKLMYYMGEDDVRICFEMLEKNEQRQMLCDIINKNECVSLCTLEIDGNDLNGICSGKDVGRLLKTLLFEVIEEKCQNNKNILQRRAEEILRSKDGI